MPFSSFNYSISEDIFALVSLEHIVLSFSRYGIFFLFTVQVLISLIKMNMLK